MHYKNGREAKQGDIVVCLTLKKAGILHCLQPNSQTCNARMAPTSENDAYVTLSECLHIDDLKTASVPDTSKKE